MLAISIVALVISGFALPFTAWAARATARQAQAARDQTAIQREQVAAAREQTELQRELARDALQPYVWADIQPDMQQGTVLQVVVGNSGPTVARNVVVTFDPPLPAGDQHTESVAAVQQTLGQGLRSLAPGRVIRWPLGPGFDLLATDSPQLRTVRVDGEGPFGPLSPFEVEIDINEWRQARDAPDGSLHHVRGAIKDLTKAVNKIEKTVGRAAGNSHQQSYATDRIEISEVADKFVREQITPPDTPREGST